MTQIRTKQQNFGWVMWYGMRWPFYCLMILMGISSSYAALPSSIPDGLILYDTGVDLTGTYCSITLQQGTKVIFTTQLQSSGNSQVDMILVRFDNNGLLDKTFGFNGRIRIGSISMGADIDLTGINGQLCSGVIQADGKIVLGGMMHLASESQHIWVLRLNQDGQLDKSFGKNGFYELTTFSGGYYNKTAIAIDSEQRIIVANSTDAPIGSYYNSMGLVIRLTNNGQLDSSFNNTGSFVQNGMLFFSSILVQSDNSILLGGYNAVLIHLTSGGKIDTSFADNGILTLPLNISSNFTVISSINTDSVGRVVATGYGYWVNYATIVYRFDAKGNLDPSFVNGYVPYLGYTPEVRQLFNLSNIWLVGSTSVAYYDDYVAVASLKEDGTGNPFNTADISYPSTPIQRTWRMIFDNNVCGEPAEGAIFQGNKILVLGTYNCRGYNGIYLVRFNNDGSIDETFGAEQPTPEEKVAVVLVHGIGGSASSFGDDGKFYFYDSDCEGPTPDSTCQPKFGNELRKEGFFVGQPFDFSSKTTVIPIHWKNYTIEQLAGELSKHLRCVENEGSCAPVEKCESVICVNPVVPVNVKKIDILAHSMGGLIARTYIAGLAVDKDKNDVSEPYRGDIRKLVMAGTPNYGAFLGGVDGFFGKKQAKEMDINSGFTWTLNEKWKTLNFPSEDVLSIIGNIRQDQLNSGYTSSSDAVVLASSAALPVSGEEGLPLMSYINAGHLRLVSIDSINHPAYQLVKDFLKGKQLLDFNRVDMTRERGLVVFRVMNSITKKPLAPQKYQLSVNGRLLGVDNSLTSSETFYFPPGNLTVTAVKNNEKLFESASVETIEVRPGRPQSVIIWVTK